MSRGSRRQKTAGKDEARDGMERRGGSVESGGAGGGEAGRAQGPGACGAGMVPSAGGCSARGGAPRAPRRAEDQPGDTPPPSGGRRGCPPPQKPAGLPGAGVRAKRAAKNESAVQKKPETPSPMSVEIHATRGGRGGGQHSELLGREGGPRLLRTGRAHRQR